MQIKKGPVGRCPSELWTAFIPTQCIWSWLTLRGAGTRCQPAEQRVGKTWSPMQCCLEMVKHKPENFWSNLDIAFFLPQTNLENKSFSCKIVANLPMSHIRPFNWKTKMLLSITLQVFTFSESGLVTRSGLDCGTLQIDSVAIFCCPPLIVNVCIYSMANAMACVGWLQVLFVAP